MRQARYQPGVNSYAMGGQQQTQGTGSGARLPNISNNYGISAIGRHRF